MIPIDFQGKTLLVTGGGQGIGRSVALRCAEAGADVGIFDPVRDESEKTAEEIRSMGSKSYYFPVDVSSEEEINAAMDRLLHETGRIDFLVNSAGITSVQPFTELSREVWQKTLDVNLTGSFLCCKAVVPSMISRGEGRIVLISSASAITGTGGGAHYASSKGGMFSLTRTLSRELAPHNILTNCLAPRNVLTGMLKNYYSQEALDKSSESIPLKRLATPEEIANMVLFLCSGLATYITGQIIVVDGGKTFS